MIVIHCVQCRILGIDGRLLTFLKPLNGYEIWYEKYTLKFMGIVSIWSLSMADYFTAILKVNIAPKMVPDVAANIT